MNADFGDLVMAESRGLVAAATAIVGDRHRAEEIVQTAFERCFRRWHRVSQLDRPGAWARRVVINEAISVARRSATEQRATQRLGTMTTPSDGVADPLAALADADIWAAVRALPGDQAAAIALRYGADLGIDDIAETLEVSGSAVKSLLHRGALRCGSRPPSLPTPNESRAMNDHQNETTTNGDDDPVLSGAGARLREQSASVSAGAVEVAVLRRRTRRIGALAGVSFLVVAVLGGLLAFRSGDSGSDGDVAGARPGVPSPASVEQLLAKLPARPIDPTKVQLVSSVSTFPSCDGLIGDLRRVGAEHVGSRGFGAGYNLFQQVGGDVVRTKGAADASAAPNATATGLGAPAASIPAGSEQGDTLGTNVQVEGVDELDLVKAEGRLIYDLDGRGNLRITDATTLGVLSTLDITPGGSDQPNGSFGPDGRVQVSQLLVSGGRVAVFGTETETSKPIEGDPSATQSSTSFLTVTFVDATDAAAPKLTDRVRVEGSLVSARLVGGDIRLVTTSDLADLGFVMPTTPNSVAKALEQNRRSVASSTAADWIPDWQRTGEDPQALVPCDRVHVPDTFSGVAMTSMVTFPLGAGRFEPAATSILAPASTLYAGTDTVAISSEVWVDPIDRDRLQFENWQTAIHQFTFADADAPTYAGSGIVDGSTIGQFAFGEIGDSLGVVTTKGTPWQQQPDAKVDLTVLTPDGSGGLREASKIADLSASGGAVTAVRFTPGRVLISTGDFGQAVDVIDVTQPAEPRRAGSLNVSGTVGYFHPLPGQQALLVGSRSDQVGEGRNAQQRNWVQAQLLDVSDADAPKIISTWEEPWVSDEVAYDHHAFTYWPDRQLAMWGLRDQTRSTTPAPNRAIVLSTDGGVRPVADPEASKAPETPAPCPTVDVTNTQAEQIVGADGVILRCDDAGQRTVEWPRYQCFYVDDNTITRYAPDQTGKGSFFSCSPAPPPAVARVLVVAGRPILFTDQTLEALDPTTFVSTAVAYHPSSGPYGY